MPNDQTQITFTNEDMPMVTNFRGRVATVIRQYEDDTTIPHAFQKDVIQNAIGARPSTKWNGWRCTIDVVLNSSGEKVLVISDYGTTGLTGGNYSNAELREKTDSGYLTDHPEEKLGRISSDSNSGGVITGQGLFGIGKTLYSIASDADVCTYYFESVSVEGYRASRNKVGQFPNRAYEGENAKAWWRENVGLEPREETGTTFVIVSPKQEIIDAINDGTMEKDIQETWWRVMAFFPSEAEGIFLRGKRIGQPDFYGSDHPSCEPCSRDYLSPSVVSPDWPFRVKRWGIHLLKDNLSEQFGGFAYYRMGMKICAIDIPEMPEKYRAKFFGYIEVDDSWEAELKAIESDTHYGITKKTKKEWQNLVNFARSAVHDWLVVNGFIKTKENEDRRLHRLLDSATDIIQDLYAQLNYEPLGQGDNRKKIVVNWQNVQYPNPDEDRTVHTGDIFQYSFEILNKYLVDKDCHATVQVESSEREPTVIYNKKITVQPGQRFSETLQTVEIDPSIFEPNTVNYVVLKVKVGGAIISKKKLVYYDIETAKNSTEDFELSVERKFPKTGSRRVNPGQSVTNVVERITNNMDKPVKLRLLVQTIATISKQPIKVVLDKVVEVEPDQTLDVPCPDILFDPETYDEAVGKGQVEVRSALTVYEAVKPYPKGWKAQKYSFFAFYNTSEKKGNENSFKPKLVNQPDRHQTSWLEGHSGQWEVAINAAHPEYTSTEQQGDEFLLRYMVREENKQYVNMYIKEGNYAVVGLTQEQVESDDFDPTELVAAIDRTVQENWWKLCQE